MWFEIKSNIHRRRVWQQVSKFWQAAATKLWLITIEKIKKIHCETNPMPMVCLLLLVCVWWEGIWRSEMEFRCWISKEKEENWKCIEQYICGRMFNVQATSSVEEMAMLDLAWLTGNQTKCLTSHRHHPLRDGGAAAADWRRRQPKNRKAFITLSKSQIISFNSRRHSSPCLLTSVSS